MAETQMPSLKLNSGHLMPQLGLGTWQSKPGEVATAVMTAIEAGYRHIDGAHFYQNEAEYGAGIKAKIDDGTVKREDLFVVSKLWGNSHRPDLVLPAIKRTLGDLGLEYLDLYLIHWPVGLQPGEELLPLNKDGNFVLDNETDLKDTWRQMEELVRLGLTKSIGVSNFNKRQIEDILKIATIPPANNQVEMHPYFPQTKLIDYCTSKGITVTAYSPFCFGVQNVLEEPKLIEIGKKYGKAASQVILRWMLQKGVSAIPKSVNKSRIIENFNVLDFTLTEEDIKQVESLDKGAAGRFTAEPRAKDSKDYPFNDEF